MEGRHYGGGVLELVPSEIERLLLPVIEASLGQLAAADEDFRKAKDDLAFIRERDSLVLGKVGVKKQEQEALFNAWSKLRDRRHRVPATETVAETE